MFIDVFCGLLSGFLSVFIVIFVMMFKWLNFCNVFVLKYVNEFVGELLIIGCCCCVIFLLICSFKIIIFGSFIRYGEF